MLEYLTRGQLIRQDIKLLLMLPCANCESRRFQCKSIIQGMVLHKHKIFGCPCKHPAAADLKFELNKLLVATKDGMGCQLISCWIE